MEKNIESPEMDPYKQSTDLWQNSKGNSMEKEVYSTNGAREG